MDGLRVNHFSANFHLRVYLSKGRANGLSLHNKLGLCKLRKVKWDISEIYQMAFISYPVLDVEFVYAAPLFSRLSDSGCWTSRWTVYDTVIKPFMKMVNMIFTPFLSLKCYLTTIFVSKKNDAFDKQHVWKCSDSVYLMFLSVLCLSVIWTNKNSAFPDFAIQCIYIQYCF